MKTRYIMIGGFLGAGKTTSVIKLALYLRKKGLKVGLITNDQGNDLVDTKLITSHGFSVEEIAGGCFCCRFESLKEAAENLNNLEKPDIFIAEPVGSCTDLVASVSYPLRKIYNKEFKIAPLSVVVDPHRAQRIFGLTEGRKFSEKVNYIYKKQLEEADIIIINKIDTISGEESKALEEHLQLKYPRAKVFLCAATKNNNLDVWFNHLLATEQSQDQDIEIDYQIYGEGEALLGWLNGTLKLESKNHLIAQEILYNLAQRLKTELKKENCDIAHLKMTLSPKNGLPEVASINLVSNEFIPEASLNITEPFQEADIIINLRAEAPHELLKECLYNTLLDFSNKETNAKLSLVDLEAFQPSKPVPTHRIKSAEINEGILE